MRVGGVNVFKRNLTVIMCGLPPRACGERFLLQQPTQLFRSTPTRVGRTLSPATDPRADTVYPHARGVNVAEGALGIADARSTPTRVGRTFNPVGQVSGHCGLPPRSRGEHAICWGSQKRYRSTPAPAG